MVGAQRWWPLAVAVACLADDKVFDRDIESWWHSDVAPTMETLEEAVASHLRPSDYDVFLRATGTSVASLVEGLRACDGNASREGDVLADEALPVVMSTRKFVPHRLNAAGLHAFRALVATRIMHDVVGAAADASASDWPARLLRDGYVAEPFAALATRPDGAAALPGDLASKLDGLFRRDFAGALKPGWETFVADPDDKQLYMHVDTYMPTYKVWLFENTTARDGPFNFVRGSHHPSEHKLRWLFWRTKHLTSAAALPPPSPEVYAARGPFSEARFGFEASLRFPGFDPRDGNKTARALAYFGFEEPTPLVAERLLLVIADTSGLHARGLPEPGRRRTQLLPNVPRLPRVRGDDPEPERYGEAVGGGRNCAPRRNVFHCARHAAECQLP